MSSPVSENDVVPRARFKKRSDSGQPQSFEPVLWNKYFNIRDDIELVVGRFRIYRRGVEGPLLFLIHGGGFSALTWAVLSAAITDQVKCQCLAVDLRGHGDTSCQDDEDLSLETLSNDVINIIFAMYPTEAPPIILVGHSLGGAVAVHVAHKRRVPSLAGLVVIDVVEGSALSALQGMSGFLRSRPHGFQSLSHAIEWSVRTSQLRNIHSARVSFPGQLKRIETGQTATYELEQGTALIFSYPTFISDGCTMTDTVPSHTIASTSQVQPTVLTALTEDRVVNETVKVPHDAVPASSTGTNHNPAVPNSSLPPDDAASPHMAPLHVSRCSSSESSSDSCLADAPWKDSSNPRLEYIWRIDLMKTQGFWNGWFSGLSQRFLSIPEPKLLLLAGVDRLDKDLTIGQMQGKFQLHVFPKCGHAIQEDSPDKVAECLAKFLVRNRLTEARSSCGN